METPILRMAGNPEDSNELYIKREDLLPFSMGGNKVRIAEAFFRDMKQKGCSSMIIYGSRHSNLCRVLSALCRSRGGPCVMICSHEGGEEGGIRKNTVLVDWTGTEIVHCRKQEIAAAVEDVMKRLTAEGKTPYYIFGNKYGTGNEGTAASAYAEAYREILEYEGRQGFSFDYIFLPSGTGATQSGLICGKLLMGGRASVMGVMISSREYERAREVIREGIVSYFERAGKILPGDYQQEIHLLDQYRQEGYGKYDKRIEDCIREVYCRDGVALDPVYTAKAFWGMKEYLREKQVKGKKVLFLHTGGGPLFYDYLTKREKASLL